MTEPVEVELSPGSSSLYIFFGGIASGIAMPPFEFYNASRIFDENKIFIRDLSQCWYHGGLPGISKDIHSTAGFIRHHIGEIKPEDTYFVGNSMGGYAAILFASLIGAGKVIAFAPQTFISPFLRLMNNDFRWSRQIFAAYKKSLFRNKYWDLRRLLLRSRCRRDISIYVSEGNKLDCIHAYHVKDIPGVHIYAFDGGGHGIVKLLRDEGKLPDIMLGKYDGGDGV